MQARRSDGAHWLKVAAAVAAMTLLAMASMGHAQKPATPDAPATAASAGVLDRLAAGAPLRVGYRTDARPFSYDNESRVRTGYSVELCGHVVDALSQEVGSRELTVEWIPVTADDRFAALKRRQIDLLCGAETVTLTRRAEASFSMPIFPGGVGALVRADTPARLREVLSGRGQTFRPVWRASATQALQSRFVSAVAGTTAERWLLERIGDLHLVANVSRLHGYDAAVQALLERRTDVLFGERAILLDAAKRHRSPGELIVIDRLFTYEPLALAFGRGDEALRLIVDRTLSRLQASGELARVYATWFAEPDESTLTFFRWNALPE